MGGLADQHTFWFKFWSVIESGGWVIFNHMEIVFVVGLPLSLAKSTWACSVSRIDGLFNV